MGTRTFLSGVKLGALDLSATDLDLGVDWTVSKLEGWTGSTGSTLTLDQKVAEHGSWASLRPRFKSRILTIEGSIVGPRAAVSAALDRLNDAVDLEATRVEVVEGGRARWAFVQRQDEVLIDDSIAHAVTYSIQLAMPDPFKYGDPVVAATGLPATSGGLGVPFGVPLSIDSAVVSGQATLVNPGNARGPVLMRIDGPITAPSITHVGSGKALTFSSSLTLAAGEWLDVDMQRKTVLANGTASRAGWITSRGWSAFDPGGNTWAVTAATPTPGALVTVTATPAWK